MYYNEDEILYLNIRGEMFEIPVTVISSSANKSLLSVIYEETLRNCCRKNRSVYLAASPRMLDKILDFHISGRLHLPSTMCADEIRREFKFWMLEERHLAECCWCKYQEIQENQDISDEVSRVMVDCAPEVDKPHERNERCLVNSLSARVWRSLENPGSSKIAMAICVLSSIVALVTVLLFCLETVIPLRLPRKAIHNSTSNFENPKIKSYLETQTRPVIIYLDFICVSLIFLETVTRLICCPRKLCFFQDFLNVLDICVVIICTVIGYYEVTGHHFASREAMRAFLHLKAISTVIVLRLLRPLRKVTLIRVLWLSLKSTKSAHIFMLLLLGFCMVIFAAAIYIAEIRNSDFFWSIPEGIWWSIITMTTVGYGDVYPMTAGGRVVGIICAVIGIIILALPIPILTNAFSAYHKSYLKLKRIRKRGKKLDQNGIGEL